MVTGLPQTREVRVVCQHEAAHAVVAKALGHTVESIQIQLSDEVGAYGHTEVSDPSQRDVWDPERAYDDLLITVAGPSIDAAAGRTHPGSLHDVSRATSLSTLMVLLYGGTVEEHIKEAQRLAMQILEENSERVLTLCDLLMYCSEDGSLPDVEKFQIKNVAVFNYPVKKEN